MIDEDEEIPEAVEVPITDALDLHTFAPRDAGPAVSAWLDECALRGFREVRVIHGKGVGALRRSVAAVLERHPAVESYTTADESRGGWGATVVRLKHAPQGSSR